MLELKNINKTFRKNIINKKDIFKDFNIKVDKGEFVTIIGGNGTGKSTLMNLISGTEFPDNGRIFKDGKDVTNIPEFKRSKFIGRVFQDPLKGTAPNLTVEENLSLALLKGNRRGLKFALNKNIRNSFKDKLKELNLGLENQLTTKIGLLSGGQRQAITLLMATLNTPKILLLDEHTAALDPKSSEKILDITKKITSEHKITTLMITHNMKHALTFGTRTIMLGNSGLIMDLNSEERENINVKELYSKL